MDTEYFLTLYKKKIVYVVFNIRRRGWPTDGKLFDVVIILFQFAETNTYLEL